MDATTQAERGRVDAYPVCPHPTGGVVAEYAIDCDCREPEPGLINQLLKRLQESPKSAVMIRHCQTNLLVGQAAGVRSFHYDGGDLFEFTKTAISANFGLVAVDSVEATLKASRS